MERKRMTKIAADIVILLCGGILVVYMYRSKMGMGWMVVFLALLLILIVGVLVDLSVQFRDKKVIQKSELPVDYMGIQQLILLDEQGKPIKSWDISGKIALVIGKKNREEEVDIDLEECEYSTFIDPEHAVLNYCQNDWYIEDLGSQNGVKIRKVEDGICYKVLNRPCRVAAGDIIYIASTRLLLS